ncbi:MAG: lysylphosphatidylglycerol synthase transmembrane domain-containing protein [Candidatus Saccharicenans sp.]
MKKTKKAWIIGLFVVLLFFAFILYKIKPARLLETVVGVGWGWVVVAGLVNILNIAVESLRWQQIVFIVKRKVRFTKIFEAFLVGFFGNIIFPLRVGDGFRIYFVSQQEMIKIPEAIWTFILDRLADIIFFLVLIGVTGLYFPLSGETERAFHLLLFGVSIIVLLFIVVAYFSGRGRKESWPAWRKRLNNLVDRFLIAWRGLLRAKNLLLVSLTALFSWILRVVIIWAMLRAFHLNLPLVASVIGLIMVNLGLAAVNTPANVGGFELGLVAALKLFSVDTEVALSCALLLHLVEVVPVFLIGGAVIIKTGFKPHQARKEAEEIEESLEEAI